MLKYNPLVIFIRLVIIINNLNQDPHEVHISSVHDTFTFLFFRNLEKFSSSFYTYDSDINSVLILSVVFKIASESKVNLIASAADFVLK